MKRSVYIGFEPTQADALAVSLHTAITRMRRERISLYPLVLRHLRQAGLYRRKMRIAANGFLVDTISDAAMSTEFAISRFLTPIMAKEGWALFMDSDVLVRCDLNELFDLADPHYAVMCVKHEQKVLGDTSKMTGQEQLTYARKNWSSVVLYNCDHPSNKSLTVDMVNSLPGRDLHRFCWLNDEEIGELDPQWNWLVGVSKYVEDVKIAHFTLGTPSMHGYERCEFGEEWREALASWASEVR